MKNSFERPRGTSGDLDGPESSPERKGSPLEQLTDEAHFAMRAKIQAEMIRDYFGIDDAYDVSNDMMVRWLKPNAALFDQSFAAAVEENPDFFEIADRDFDEAVGLVKQKFEQFG